MSSDLNAVLFGTTWVNDGRMFILVWCYFPNPRMNPQQLYKMTQAEPAQQVILLKACLVLFSSPRQDLSSSAQCSKNLCCPDSSWPTITSEISYYTLTSTASGARQHPHHAAAACCANVCVVFLYLYFCQHVDGRGFQLHFWVNKKKRMFVTLLKKQL